MVQPRGRLPRLGMAEKLYNSVGFMITRVHETGADASRRRRRYATCGVPLTAIRPHRFSSSANPIARQEM
jgi:hypothetical protein